MGPESQRMAASPRTPRRILVLDVGGTHVKFRLDARGPIEEFVSGARMTPHRLLAELRKRTQNLTYDAVSMGYPGVVFRGRIAAEPHNLGRGWVGFDFAKALGTPVRIVNDAAMQAIGSYTGGCMLFLGLGTGLGVALILDGVVEPTELGHLPYKHGHTYEDYLGERGRKHRGNRKWRRSVSEIVAHLRGAFEVDYVVLGGGNARRLKSLPQDVRLGENRNAFLGGVRLWRRHGVRVHIPGITHRGRAR
jgi:hypothetical protein